MSDIRQKKVSVMLDKERTLYYGMEAIAYLADKYGSINKALSFFSDSVALQNLTRESVGAMVSFVYAGLMHEDEKLTEKIVMKNLDMANMKIIFEAASMAFQSMTPESEKAESENPTPAAT